jgi:hypothetical protein
MAHRFDRNLPVFPPAPRQPPRDPGNNPLALQAAKLNLQPRQRSPVHSPVKYVASPRQSPSAGTAAPTPTLRHAAAGIVPAGGTAPSMQVATGKPHHAVLPQHSPPGSIRQSTSLTGPLQGRLAAAGSLAHNDTRQPDSAAHSNKGAAGRALLAELLAPQPGLGRPAAMSTAPAQPENPPASTSQPAPQGLQGVRPYSGGGLVDPWASPPSAGTASSAARPRSAATTGPTGPGPPQRLPPFAPPHSLAGLPFSPTTSSYGYGHAHEASGGLLPAALPAGLPPADPQEEARAARRRHRRRVARIVVDHWKAFAAQRLAQIGARRCGGRAHRDSAALLALGRASGGCRSTSWRAACKRLGRMRSC